MQRLTLIFVILLGFAVPAPAATISSFGVGDVSVIGYGSDAPDTVVFVPWLDVDAGESIYFTDSGFFDDATLRDSESAISWTNDTGSTVVAGTVIVSGTTADLGTSSGTLGLSASGDQIFVGKSAFPTAGDTTKPGSAYASGDLLFGINFDTATWGTDATSSNNSDLPNVLDVANGNIAIAEVDNGQYIGSRTGMTVEQFKTAVTDPSNWSTSNSAITFDSTDFTITAVPEPGSVGVIAGAALCALVWRRRRKK